jgi:hypothetical protein
MKMVTWTMTIAFLAAVCTGCADKSGLLSGGPAGRSDIQMIVYQNQLGYWSPEQITQQKDIDAIYDAVNHPDGKSTSMMPRTHYLAFVKRDGSIILYATTPGLNGVDITADRSSKILGPALRAAEAQARTSRLTLTSPVQSVVYYDSHGNKDLTAAVSGGNRALLQELLGCYSPLTLKGNQLCKSDSVRSYMQKTPVFLTIKLAKPDEFDAIIAQKKTGWDLKTYDTSLRMQHVNFDTITIFRESAGYARFVFTDNKSNECLFTETVKSMTLLKSSRPLTRRGAAYGPDLFNKVVSLIEKS